MSVFASLRLCVFPKQRWPRLNLFPVLAFFFLTACQPDERSDNTTTFTGEAMTMTYKIIIGSTLSHTQQQAANTIIHDTFEEVHNTCDKWNPHSELSMLNSLQAGVPIAISPLLTRLLNETQYIVELTQGRFDPTIEPIQALWKQSLLKNQHPIETAIAAIAPAIGWDKIHIENGIFYKDHHLTKMDLGGIAKGLCIDLIIERLALQGYQNLFVEWGGEIRTSGHHPEGRPWTVYISRLNNTTPSDAVATLFLHDQAIATSGDYLQNWCLRNEKGTTVYCHIFDPKKLQPLEASHTSVASVSVLASSCAIADGLATAAMLFPTINAARAWAEEIQKDHPEISFWIISRAEFQ